MIKEKRSSSTFIMLGWKAEFRLENVVGHEEQAFGGQNPIFMRTYNYTTDGGYVGVTAASDDMSKGQIPFSPRFVVFFVYMYFISQ